MKIDRHAKVAIKYLNPCAIIKIEEFNLIWKLNTTASLFDLISLNILKSLVVFSFDVSLFLHDILFFILLTNNWIFVIKQQVSNDSKMQIIQMEHILEKKSTLQRKSPVKRGPITSLYSPKPKYPPKYVPFLTKHNTTHSTLTTICTLHIIILITTNKVTLNKRNTQINHETAACNSKSAMHISSIEELSF